jgi:SDR family mycofactocin-dependent oxidoreductase
VNTLRGRRTDRWDREEELRIMPTYDFGGTVAFVTGAARGQGASHAEAYAEHGADVVALDIGDDKDGVPYDLGTGEELEETVAAIEDHGQRGLSIRADVSRAAHVEAAVEEALDEFGRIDILANNAGVTTFGRALEIDAETWDALVETNLKGPWLCSKHVARHMVERGSGGRIINTSSNAGLVGAPFLPHYTAAKHGVIGLTKAMALELAEHDVTVNAVCPTAVETPLIEEAGRVYGAEPMEEMARLGGPSNLFGDRETISVQPEDVTEAFMWLSSDAARYVTGTAVPVDGGFTAK